MKNLSYNYTNESDLTGIRLEDGEFRYIEEPIYWSEIELTIGDKTVNLSAQYDCGDSWCWYNLGGDGEGSSYTLEHFFPEINQDSREFDNLVEKLDDILEETRPKSREITTEMKAEYLKEYCDEEEPFFKKADAIQKIAPEKGYYWALVLAYYIRNGIQSVGDFECNLQIYSGLSKTQTQAITEIR